MVQSNCIPWQFLEGQRQHSRGRFVPRSIKQNDIRGLIAVTGHEEVSDVLRAGRSLSVVAALYPRRLVLQDGETLDPHLIIRSPLFWGTPSDSSEFKLMVLNPTKLDALRSTFRAFVGKRPSLADVEISCKCASTCCCPVQAMGHDSCRAPSFQAAKEDGKFGMFSIPDELSVPVRRAILEAMFRWAFGAELNEARLDRLVQAWGPSTLGM